MRPETGFARNGDVRIAYQVVGDGPFDLVMTAGYVSHVDLWWMMPETTRFVERLASFSRLILYDKRGTGLSDPSPSVPSMEDRMEDLHAVLDEVGSERAALFGWSEGGPLSMLFAATYPERTIALALFGTFARWPAENYHPELLPVLHEILEGFAATHEHWGEGHMLAVLAPDHYADKALRRQFGLFERLSASPAMASGLLEAVRDMDVTHVLSSISAPTLVMHRVDEPTPVVAGREIAEQISGARLMELAGNSHLPFLGDVDAVLDPLEEFLTGAPADHAPERALVSVLFTDIVGSTELAGRLGDARWRSLLERHDAVITREVRASGGSVVKSLGDGVFARFDSPARAVRAARRIVSDAPDEVGVAVRAGVHAGECEILGDDLGGMAVHVGARIAAQAEGGEVLVSSVVRDLVLGSPLEFEDRGRHQLKGVPGEWELLAVTDGPGQTPPTPERVSPVAPNAELARPADLAAVRVGRVAMRSPRLRRRLVAARGLGQRLRGAPSV